MTREKWKSLTDDEKKIKISELCGWRYSGPVWYQIKL